MAIAVAWTAETTLTGTATSHAVTLPASGIDPGQLILIYCSTQESVDAGAPATPSGYTQRWSLGHASAFRPRITCVYRIADGSEESDVVTFVWGSGVETHIVAVGLTGADISTAFDATQTGPTTGSNGTNLNPAAITTVTDGAWVLAIAAGNSGTTTPTPAALAGGTFSNVFDQSPDARALVIQRFEQATAGVVDPGNMWATSVHTIDNWTTVTDALRPAPAATVASAGGALAAAVAPGATTDVEVPPVDIGPAPLAFAEGGHTRPRVEVALNHAGTIPTEWAWTDLSDRLVSRLGDLKIGLKRGRADAAAATDPSQATLILDNSDGALTPGFAMSPWWPDVDVGLPLRIWEDGTEAALVLPGEAEAYAYTPDHASLDITGDLDVRIRIDPASWSVGIGSTLLTRPQRLVSKWLTGDRSWWFALFDAGWLQTAWSDDGTTTGDQGQAFPSLVAALRPTWIGWTLDVDDGAGGHQHVFYRWDGATPPDDITTWTVVAVDTDTGTVALHSSAAPVELGSRDDGAEASFAGRILAFELRDGINGTVVANPDFTAQVPGTTSFTDDAGRTWHLSGAAEISRRRLRFCGEITEIDPIWPYGDHLPLAALDDDRPTEARVAVTASGVLRRLTTGQDPLRSTLARKVTTTPGMTAYWPGEDGRMAVQFGPAIPGSGPLNAFGLDMASNSTLPASAPLPSIPAGGLAIWQGAVPTGPSVQWAVEMVLFIETPETDPAATQILGITTAGPIARWAVAVNDTEIRIIAYDALNAEVHSYDAALFDIWDKWVLFRLDATQAVGIEFTWTITVLDTGGGAGDTDTIVGQTLGAVTGIDTHVTAPPDGMSFGHLIVHDGTMANGWLAGADTAWAGESAAHRFRRLCDEEGIPVEIVGDPAAHDDFRGSLAASQAMGPQGRKRLAELLAECVEVDMGILIETTGIPGLIFRCRTTIEDQDAQLALDAGTNDIADLQPTRDNQDLVNDLTVTSTGGSSAVDVDVVSVARKGRYADSVEINGVGGVDIQSAIIASQDGLAAAIATQNTQQAGWRLSLGTTEGMRYPTLVIDLGTAPHLIDTWLDTALGDRLTLDGLPVQHPTDVVELLIQHVAETVTPTAWIVELTVTPGEPWMTGELVE